MRLIRRKSDWGVALAVCGSLALLIFFPSLLGFLLGAPFLIFIVLVAIVFCCALLYAPLRVFFASVIQKRS
jgi:hypothetical protein